MTCQQDDKRMQGLKILARMIAADYKRRLREAEVRSPQLGDNAEVRQNPPAKGGRGVGHD